MRVGLGYDVHRLVKGRKLILGGVAISHELGLLGHSDADVLVHAVMDALLGAAALGDIGKHFPDTDPQYLGISSIELLEHVGRLLQEQGYVIENIDATVIAERPKLRSYIGQMEENIARALGLAEGQVNIKATTEEGLGFSGAEQGIASQATCVLSGLFEGSVPVVDSEAVCGDCSGCRTRSESGIRYLGQREKQRTRKMYEACFTEDSMAFVDYYYDYKVRDNRILVMEDGCSVPQDERRIQAKLHLNPYFLKIGRKLAAVDYIVAVATDESVRRQGKMTKLLRQALRDMAAARHPFTYLIPARPEVYRSSGFVFVPVENYESMADVREAEGGEALQWAAPEDFFDIAEFANAQMQAQYDLYVYRTEEYYQRMQAELAAQDGGILLWKDQGAILGLALCGIIENRVEVQELIAPREQWEKMMSALKDRFAGYEFGVVEMPFMFRILDVHLTGNLLVSERPFCLRVKVKDDVIPDNNGCFEFKVSSKGCVVTDIAEQDAEYEMDISELTEILFSYMKIFLRDWV